MSSDLQLEDNYSVITEVGPLRSLDEVRPLYLSPAEPFAEEILIPGFQVADRVDCMVGFFSSEILASLAPGLATYIAGSKNSFRLIISPLLCAKDRAVIEEGLKSAEDVATRVLCNMTVTEDLLQQHTLKCLSWLLQTNRIEIKVALMKDALFHLKAWLFEDREDVLAAHGSSNATYSGIRKNIEQIAISKSWQDSNQQYITDKLRREFGRLWEDRETNCIVVDMPNAVRHRLLQTYHSERPPTEDALRGLYGQALKVSEETEIYGSAPLRNREFRIPHDLRYEDGPFGHQGKAVEAWCDAGHRGVLEMATGSGKTNTAMIGAYELYKSSRPLLIVVAAPYIPLIEQWCDEIAPFGLNPVNLAMAANARGRARKLQRLRRELRLGLSKVGTVVVSHDTLCTSEFVKEIDQFECARLLIADEVHNLGRPSFISDPPECFEHRLGLSATPIRQYDEEGTKALFEFFGSAVFQFTLKEAIGRCLVEYDYYVHPVYLTDREMDEWFDLTGKIKQNAWRDEDGKPDDYLAKLLRDRRALLETASGKVSKLKELLDGEDTGSLRHTLIYTSDKGPKQLNEVNRLLHGMHILFHQLTAEETVDPDQTKRIIRSFQNGEIQILTAKRVLDEGVNVPQICKAFVLASTTVKRQWVQRRGRLLRTCNAIGKTYSIIHDLLALPPGMDEGLDPEARSLVSSELQRVQEFALLARNAGKPDGPLRMIDKMVDAAYR